VVLDTGEELLEAALGRDSALTRRAQAIEPFIVPYDQLARVDGWTVWLGHPPVPDGVALLPAPDHLMWDEPGTALAATAAAVADYAARRGARSADAMKATLERESPIAIVLPGEITVGLRRRLDEIAALGVPVLERPTELESALASTGSFAMRRRAHGAGSGRAHDPALSFQTIVVKDRIGGDARSTYLLHNEGQREALEVVGMLGEHVGIEIGLRGAGITVEATADLEPQAALIPSFLSGVSSALVDESLEIGWRLGARPTPEEVGEAFRVWLKALDGAELVDVRIVFAPADERSDRLAEMRARAEAFRRVRESALGRGDARG
jgi:hypothetical protein